MKLFGKLIGKQNDRKKSETGSFDQTPSNEVESPSVMDRGELSENDIAHAYHNRRKSKEGTVRGGASIGQRTDSDSSIPRDAVSTSTTVRRRLREDLLYDETRNSPAAGNSGRGTPVSTSSPKIFLVNQSPHRLYQTHSNHSLGNRTESFQGGASVYSLDPPPSSPIRFPSPSIGSPGLAPPEVMELNRLMSLGYSYETSLAMLGINPPPAPAPTPIMYPPYPMAVPPASVSMMMSGAPGYYPTPMPMQFQGYPPYSHYPMPAAGSYGVGPVPTQSQSFGGGYYEEEDAELRLALQRSLEEEQLRKQMATENELLIKEAVERANERAVQIALQRSFEEHYGPGSYQRYQAEQQRNQNQQQRSSQRTQQQEQQHQQPPLAPSMTPPNNTVSSIYFALFNNTF